MLSKDFSSSLEMTFFVEKALGVSFTPSAPEIIKKLTTQ
jgi:hypothetical protein